MPPMIELNSIVVLSRPAGTERKGSLADGQAFIELHLEDAARISDADRRHGRRGDIERITNRFRHGMRYFAIEEAQGIVAWFWVVHGGPRYLDEMCWLIQLQATHVWARDAFVAPSHRGRRLLMVMMELASVLDGRPVTYLSDVSQSNFVSLRAHRSLGFEKIATIRSLAIGKHLLLRNRPPACLPQPQAIRPAQRLIRLTEEEYAWHKAHIA
jgi:GNAT superfamily N-acetyltransferase